MPSLKPIPSPLRQRLRHFKTKFLPGLIFSGAVVVIGILWRDQMAAPAMVGSGDGTLARGNSHQSGGLARLPVAQLQKVHADVPLKNVLFTDAKLAEAKPALPVNLRLPTALQLCPDELVGHSVAPGTQ